MRTRSLSLGAGLTMAALLLSGCTAAPVFTAHDVLAQPVPAGVRYADVPESAPPAPDGRLTLLNGDALSLAEVSEGRPVVLLFLEPWCTTCAERQADLNEAAERYDGAVTFIGVSSAGTAEELEEYARAHDVPYPLVRDVDRGLAKSFAVDEAPFAVFIAEGNLLLRGWRFYPDDLGEAIDALIVESLPE